MFFVDDAIGKERRSVKFSLSWGGLWHLNKPVLLQVWGDELMETTRKYFNWKLSKDESSFVFNNFFFVFCSMFYPLPLRNFRKPHQNKTITLIQISLIKYLLLYWLIIEIVIMYAEPIFVMVKRVHLLLWNTYDFSVFFVIERFFFTSFWYS